MLLERWNEKQGKLKERRSLPNKTSVVYFKTLNLRNIHFPPSRPVP